MPKVSSHVKLICFPVSCRFRLPDGLRLEHLEGLAKRHKDTTPKDTPFIKVFGSHVDDSQTWDFVTWMRSVTSLPIFVKVRGAPACTTHLCFVRKVLHWVPKQPTPLDATVHQLTGENNVLVCR